MKLAVIKLVTLVIVLVHTNKVNSEPPVQQNSGGGWGPAAQSGTYSQGYNQPTSGGYSGGGGGDIGGYSGQTSNSNGGWQQQQPLVGNAGSGGWMQQQPQSGGGGWMQQQPQSGGGGWNQQPQKQQSGGENGWKQNQQKDQGGNGWGPQLNFELDSANLSQHLNPRNLIKSIVGIPRRIVNFIRESGLYLLFIPLLLVLPLMLLAFNVGRTFGGLGHGWGWGWSKRSLDTLESGIIGYLKSPAWQKVAETLMDEHVFDSVMKSIEKFNKKDW